jgi:hypothetical protein
MKTKLITYTMLFTAIFLFHSCTFSQIRGEGEMVKQDRNLSEFNKIDFSVSGTIYLTQGTPQKLTVEGQQNILDILETEVKGNTLELKFNKKRVNYKDLKFYITVAKIDGLNLSGSGNIYCENGLNTNDLDLSLSGSGEIKLNGLKATKIEADIAGSGNITLKGSEAANELEIEIAGSGDVRTEELPVNEIKISMAGSGSCKVNAVNKLNVDIAGSGSVLYRGNPQINSDVSGSGKVRKLE